MSWIIEENLDPALQDWGEAYKELCVIIKAKLPQIKHIDFYYGQDQFVDQDGNWNPFPCPAVLLDFRAAKVSDLGDDTQEIHMDITMYLYMETVQDTHHGSAGQRRAMEFVGLMRKLHQAMHGASGEHFSPLSRVDMQRKADAPPYAYVFGQTYRCVLLDNSGSKQWNFTEAGTLGLEIEPHSAPPVPVGTLVVVRNSDDSYSVEVEAPDTHTLPNVTHTDSNGADVELPAMQPFVATPQHATPAPMLREYTVSGAWTHPPGLKEILVYCWSGAGGGGTGRRTPNIASRSGGGSGGGSTLVIRRIPAALLGSVGSTQAVVIGSGGAGGPEITTGTVNGNTGTRGGDSSFGTLVLAKGAGSGGGGTTGNSNAGLSDSNPDQCIPARGPAVLLGGASRIAPTIAAGLAGADAYNGECATASGGSGGGTWSGGPSQYQGGAGGGMWINGVLTPGAHTADGASDVHLWLLEEFGLLATHGPGTGGGGTAASIAGSSTKGGNGGRCAGGGGSGSAAVTVGAGGAGGAGLIYVVEFYN